MIKLKNAAEIKRIKESGRILAKTMAGLKNVAAQGVSTAELDNFARNSIQRQGARPAFLGYMNFPASLCVSINAEVIHGIPGKRKLHSGDILSMDLGVNLNGYFSDAAVTLAIGRVSQEKADLVRITKECLHLGIKAAVAGQRLGDISKAIQDHAAKYNYEVVRQYSGHGVGFSLHEEPQVPNYVSRGPNPKLKPGMVLALEPMINQGTWEVAVLDDAWTVVTSDGLDSAHFEHTIAILSDGPEILTSLDQEEV